MSETETILKMKQRSDVLKIIWKSGIRWSLEYSLYGPSSPIAIVPPSHLAKCPSEPNYPLTNRVQSLVIALAITIIITITISATRSPPCQVCQIQNKNIARGTTDPTGASR